MFVTGPDVIKTVTHEDVTKEELGGAMTHNETSGVAHFMAHDDADACRMIRELLSFLPSNNLDDPPRKRLHRSHRPRRRRARHHRPRAIPSSPTTSKTSSAHVVDDGYFFEVQEHFARNIVVGFARMNGRPVGIVANQPAFLAGVLDINARSKARASSASATASTSR